MRRTNNVARSSNLNPNQPGYVQPPGFNPAPGFNPVEEGGTNTIPGEIVIPGYNPPVPIKPFSESYKFIVDQDIHKNDSSAKPFVIIGGGFAGIEIAFSLRKRWPKRSILLKVSKLDPDVMAV